MIQNYLEEVTDKFPCTCSALYAASAAEPAVAVQATSNKLKCLELASA